MRSFPLPLLVMVVACGDADKSVEEDTWDGGSGSDAGATTICEGNRHYRSAVRDQCTEITESLSIDAYTPGMGEYADITDLSELSRLTKIGTAFSIGGMDSLVDFSGLEKLVSIGSLQVEGMDALESFKGLENLRSMDGWMEPEGHVGGIFLNNLPALNDISALYGLTSFTDDTFRFTDTGVCLSEIMAFRDFLESIGGGPFEGSGETDGDVNPDLEGNPDC